MSTVRQAFYTTGGTLPRDSPSYIERLADRELHSSLLEGAFCYVLTSRQMGKSSLMVRAAARLRSEGYSVVVLDLTAAGQLLSPEQWYLGLLASAGRQLGFEDEVEEFWLDNHRYGAAQRFFRALSDVLLPRCPTRLFLFVDEIDAVQSLPFSADEFFSAIRECYNRRVDDEQFRRLTFCLLGVATPSDLIRNTRTTPFNIGRRIDLTDFTLNEAAPLSEGLLTVPAEDQCAILARILFWTGGHPYLTQRLCRAVAEAPKAYGPPVHFVDGLCRELFLATAAMERDDNLLFVRDRLIRAEVDLSGLLELYSRIRAGRRVPNLDNSPLMSVLRLSGIVRVEADALIIRNRIYSQVFDAGWISRHMPDEELRRQKRAYRRGLARAAALSSLVILTIAALAIASYVSRNAAIATSQLKAAQNRVIRDRLYTAELDLARLALDAGNTPQAREILDRHSASAELRPYREFAWRFLRSQCRSRAICVYRGLEQPIWTAAFSPDGRTIAIGGQLGDIHVISPLGPLGLLGSSRVRVLRGHSGEVKDLAFSPDGKRLYSSGHEEVIVWDLALRQGIMHLAAHAARMSLSRDGRMLAVGLTDGSITLWNASKRSLVTRLRGSTSIVTGLSFSRDGSFLIAAHSTAPVEVWSIPVRRIVRKLTDHRGSITGIAVSPDGAMVAAPAEDASIRLWELSTGRTLASLRGHGGVISAVAFTPDGRSLASVGEDGAIHLWDISEKVHTGALLSHGAWIYGIAPSPKGRLLATTSDDGALRLWDADLAGDRSFEERHGARLQTLQCSGDGRLVATSTSVSPDIGEITIRERRTGRTIARIPRVNPKPGNFAFLPDGDKIVFGQAGGSNERGIRIWDGKTNRVRTLAGPHTSQHFAASRNGRWIASTSGATHSVVLWDLGRDKGADLGTHAEDVTGVCFSPDSGTLVSYSADSVIKVWDAATRKLITSLNGHKGPMLTASFSHDGAYLATAGEDRRIIVWDTHSWKPLFNLTGHTRAVLSVVFSPDGETIASAGRDGTVLLWSTRLRQRLITLTDLHEEIGSVVFTPAGDALLVAGTDRVWSYSAPSLKSLDDASGEEPNVKLVNDSSSDPVRERLAFQTELRRAGYLLDWLVLGPVELPTNLRQDRIWLDQRQILDEALMEPRAGDAVNESGREFVWKEMSSDQASFQFEQAIGNPSERHFGYAACYVLSPREVPDAQLWIGHFSDCGVYLNGRRIYAAEEWHTVNVNGLVAVPVRLRRGENTLLFKTRPGGYPGPNGWGGFARLTDSYGRPIPGARLSTAPGSACDD